MIVRRLYNDRPVSRNEDLWDVVQMVSPTTFRATVLVCATESDPVWTPDLYIHAVDDRTVVNEGQFSFAVPT